MSEPLRRSIICAVAVLLAMSVAAMSVAAMSVAAMSGAVFAAGAGASSGAVIQSIGPPVAQNPSPPPLRLSDAQRAEIAKTLARHLTGVSFALQTAKSAANVVPAVGGKIPKGVKAHPLPAALFTKVPALKEFKYIKFKDQVLIVDPMSKKIVALIPPGRG